MLQKEVLGEVIKHMVYILLFSPELYLYMSFTYLWIYAARASSVSNKHMVLWTICL